MISSLVFYNQPSITYSFYCISTSVFLIGLLAFIESTNFLSVLVNTEIMMLGINFSVITTFITLGDTLGQVYALGILAITAAETVVGLSILILLYRTKSTISFDQRAALNT